jgi:hypothetical protein
MAWIELQLRKIPVRHGLNVGRQSVKALPKTL